MHFICELMSFGSVQSSSLVMNKNLKEEFMKKEGKRKIQKSEKHTLNTFMKLKWRKKNPQKQGRILEGGGEFSGWIE